MKIEIVKKLYLKKMKNSKEENIVELFIDNEIDLFSKYSIRKKDSVGNTNSKINNDIIDYLVNEVKIIPIKNRLKIYLKVVTKIINDNDLISKMIKNNVIEKITIINKRINKININSLLFALLGMLFIGVTQVLQFIEKRYSLNEFVIVMSWVFMWKAVDLMFFERAELMKEKGILLKIFFSEINIQKN